MIEAIPQKLYTDLELFEKFQAFVDNPKRSRVVNAPGATGTEISGGYLTEKDFTPPDLQGTHERADMFDRMRKDAFVWASFKAVTGPIRAAEWDIEPASDDPEHEKHADFLRENFLESEHFNWADALRRTLNYLIYGFMPMAKQYFLDRETNQILLHDLEERLPRTIYRWVRNPQTGDLDGIEQSALQQDDSYKTIVIPRRTFCYFVNEQEGDNFRGESILRGAYGAWWRRDLLLKIEAIKHERWGIPTPEFELPEGYNQDDYDKLIEIGESYRVHEKGYLITLPNGKTRLLGGSGTGQGTNIHESIQRESKEILFNTLSQFLSLGVDNTGSRAVGSVLVDFFFNSLDFITKDIATVIKKDLFVEWIDLNFGPQSKYPNLVVTKLQKANAEQVLQSVPGLIQNNVITPDDNLENTMRAMLNLPLMAEENEGQERKKQVPVEKPDDVEDVKEKQAEIDEKEEMTDCGCGEKHFQDSGKSWRKFTDLEKRIGMPEKSKKIKQVENDLVQMGQDYKADNAKIMMAKGLKLLMAGKGIDEFEKSLEKILPSMQQKFQADYRRELNNIYKQGQADVKDEIKKQKGVNFKDKEPTETIIESDEQTKKTNKWRAIWDTALLIDLLKKEFDKEMRKQYNSGVIDSGKILNAVNKLVGRDYNRTVVESTHAVYGLGRAEGAKSEGSKVFIRSEINDQNICENCRVIDGVEFTSDDPVGQTLLGGPNPECEGGDQCRGVNIFVTEGSREE